MDGINYTLLIAQLKRQEGLKLKPYRCTANKLTIGYGRNLEDNGVSEIEAETMLRNDIIKAEKNSELFPWYHKLDGVRQAIIINMIFNMGFEGLKKFVKMIAAIEKNDYITASMEMKNSSWFKQVGVRGEELTIQMVTGKFKDT
jgi:lysozyme